MVYKARYRCKHCLAWLSDHEYAYSSGVCPYCGNTDGDSFVDAEKIAVKAEGKRNAVIGVREVKWLCASSFVMGAMVTHAAHLVM